MRLKVFAGALAVLTAASLFGCANFEREKRMQMKHHGAYTLAGMALAHPYLQTRIDASPGYLILQRSEAKFPMMKNSVGKGIVVDSRSGDCVSTKLLELDIDGAWGTGNYTALYIFQSKDDYMEAFTNAWRAVDAGDIFVSADGGPSVIYSVQKIAVKRP